jgi:L-seryl-tRNA(Ser) seleniumtransferase
MASTVAAEWQHRYLRQIPPVNVVLEASIVRALLRDHDRDLVTAAVTETLRETRQVIVGAAAESDLRLIDLSADAIAVRVRGRLERRLRPSLRRVVNATGVVLHTNMGRSPLADEALAHVMGVATRYSNLELDLSTGERGTRYSHVEELVCRLTAAEAAMVVNNNAGAVLLVLSALCQGREVVVSRGELVEIGGAFRVPDVMVQGGAHLVEVGTTNKTHLRDYEKAITPRTAAILKVHSSNFKIIGFTEAPAVPALAELAHRHEVPLLVDWGSGVMVDLARFGLEHESTMPELLGDGADLVTFSGDKLLGGPQGGFIVGRRSLVDQCRRHPLTRALRIDKLTLAATEATLKLYLEPEKAMERIPTLKMLGLTRDDLRPAAERLALAVREALPGATVEIQDGFSQAGGGSLPGVEIPTVLVAVTPTQPAHQLEAALRRHDPAVMVRIHDGRILLDPRTLWDDETSIIAAALGTAMCSMNKDGR